jgi:thioredoxin 1
MEEGKEKESTAVSDEDPEMARIREKKMHEMEERAKAEKEGRSGGAVINHPVTITDGTFVEMVRKHPMVVVDCWAAWCGPCRMVAPIIDELAKEYAGKIVFAKLNVDENPRVATEFAIMAIPTIFIFKNGEPVDVVQGAMPKPYFEAKLKEWL